MRDDFWWRVVGGVGASVVLWAVWLAPYAVMNCYPRDWRCYILWICFCDGAFR